MQNFKTFCLKHNAVSAVYLKLEKERENFIQFQFNSVDVRTIITKISK